jgi:hypothetical protein
MIRTKHHKLATRPNGQSEFYDLKKDPRELDSVFRHKTYAGRQEALAMQMLDWYIRTSGVVPKGYDPRSLPWYPLG